MEAEREIFLEAQREDLAREEALAERGRKRSRMIMVMGAIFSLLLYPVSNYLWRQVMPFVGNAGAAVVVSLLPLMLGSLIAFLGMTMTGPRCGVVEWGIYRPSRCFFFGSLPIALGLIFPLLFVILASFAIAGWLLMILGGWITATILARSSDVKF
ncbi:hypothetical protein [Luteolibacter luteus]|uniref:Uncharacterized protein n=1 Tax=Luteolibacter luteus TaxID=2728835 RepID=A0A858RDI3_9BACT|nr:hypothetical protein [Luteolibacter luteus]QJE94792.1 hypothetical protein HHL09_03020 [Luteolibacter luteus]